MFVAAMNYLAYCELIFQDWKSNRLPSKGQLFEMEVVPEPYLLYGSAEKPLYQLLTNPGTGMPHIQSHSAVKNLGVGTYAELAKHLAKFYLSDEFKSAGLAYRRNVRALEVAKANGFSGVFSVETIPYHSDRLNKTQALRAIGEDPTLKKYSQLLKEELADKAVLVVSACSSKRSIDLSTATSNPWLSFQADLIGLCLKKAKVIPLVRKGDKVTSAQLREGQKNMVLMMGSNALPSGSMNL